MTTFYFRYLSISLIALDDRKHQQAEPPQVWRLAYPDITMVVKDALISQDSINLHVGMELYAELKQASLEEAEQRAKAVAETVLSLLSYCASSPCGNARLFTSVELNPTEQPLFRMHMYRPDEPILGSTRVVNAENLEKVWTAYAASPHQQILTRALHWLRKGLDEDNSLLEFLYYWIVLEVLRGILKRQARFGGKRRPAEWDGVKYLLVKKLAFHDFDKMKAARNRLLHGFAEMSPTFVEEIARNYLVPCRKAANWAIATVMGLPDELAGVLAEQETRRLRIRPWQVVEGRLQGFPDAIALEQLLSEGFPILRITESAARYNITDDGQLSITVQDKYAFKAGTGTILQVNAFEQLGDPEAGISSARLNEIGPSNLPP